ncbi:hypothetical protein BJX61DRAFT_511969 [Aspergillus egyptiacus]|nr:hypothetical protein BJX61DRAFT_511969 [Aspergillus egyptiacus]
MAYDGFQHGSHPYGQTDNINPPNMTENHPASSFEPPYPYHPSSDQINMPQPQVPPNSAPPQGYYPEPPREQTNWPPPPPPPPSQTGRINEAVNSAAGSYASSYVSPDLVAQITAAVIQQLGAAGISSPANSQPASQPAPPPPQWGSPQVYQDPCTPQTPRISHGTPPPAAYPPPPQQSEYAGSSQMRSTLSPAPQERKESPSQFSDQSQRTEARPQPQRTDTFPSTLEKIWGKLFDEGKPTPRLGQFLRGIATHLIENYPPANTLVVVPEKLQKFYADTDIPSDPYPWQDIFDDHTSSISRLFREVEAEHHLVQAKLDERPDIPGLTPRGFETWASLMILAHPDKEFERLQKAVLNMPISNPDNKKERFPKEIPRRLFPETPDLALRAELDQYIRKHCTVDLPPITDEEIKKVASQRHKSSASPSVSNPESNHSANERERKTYQTPTSAVVEDDEDAEQSPPAIERKRKPYTAQPGGGKVYDGPGNTSHRHANSFSTGSGIKEVRPAPASTSESPPLPYRSGSRGHRRGRSGNTTTRSRSRSRGFPAGSDYRHSDGDLLNGPRTSGATSSGDYYYNQPSSNLLEQYRELDRGVEDQRLYEQVREREKEREKSKYHDSLPSRTSWAGEEDYYRGLLGGQGGGSAGSGYDYKSYR